MKYLVRIFVIINVMAYLLHIIILLNNNKNELNNKKGAKDLTIFLVFKTLSI